MSQPTGSNNTPSRRSFMKQSGAVASAAALAGSLTHHTHAAATGVLKIGLVGCGGRGTGATAQALAADKELTLYAMGDVFQDKVESRLKALQGKGKIDVPKERQFVGFDAYKQVIDSGIDVVILATAPGWRPVHFEYAVNKGVHVFMEKPVAVDAGGARKVLAAAKEAKKKNLKVGVGLQRHHDDRYIETIKRIQGGEIGEVVSTRSYWNGRTPWVRARTPEQTEMEYQMRNWYFFNWLCGDHITEQHIHNLDVCNWVMGDYPAFAQGMGGRLLRNGKDHGQIFDHHAVEFFYAKDGWDSDSARYGAADGAFMFSQCRHMSNCFNSVSEHVHGTKGYAQVNGFRLYDRKNNEIWRWPRKQRAKNPYQKEHDDLFQAIRKDTPYNEAEYGAMSSMTSVLGRMATYSGQMIPMKKALAQGVDVFPYGDDFKWDWKGKAPVMPDGDGRYPVAHPGKTKLL